MSELEPENASAAADSMPTEAIPLDVTLQLYEEINETQRYEGEGLWNRFNILVTLHMVLFGVVSFIYSQLPQQRAIIGILSVAGSLLAAWGFYVLRRLWLWHVHWKDTLRTLEQSFPHGLPRPFSNRPRQLQKSSAWYQTWLLAYTQPFMLVLLLTWLAVVVLFTTGLEVPKKSASPSNGVQDNAPQSVGVDHPDNAPRRGTTTAPR